MATKSVVKLLTRQDILAASDVVTEQVAVPEWGGSVMVRSLSGRERDDYDRSLINLQGGDKARNLRNMRAKLVVLSCYDSDGNRLFAEGDLDALGKKSSAALSRVFRVAQRLSGITDDDVDELKAELKDDPNASSGSD